MKMNIEKIKKLFEKTDSIANLSKEIGINRSYCYEILNGKTNIGSDILERIAKYFDVPVGYFFDEDKIIDESSKKKVLELEEINLQLRKDLEFYRQAIFDKERIIDSKEEANIALKDKISILETLIEQIKKTHPNADSASTGKSSSIL